MKILPRILLACAVLVAGAGATTVTGTISDAGGHLLTGFCTITPIQAFTSGSGWRIVGAPAIASFSNGAFSASLVPTDSATSAGQYYSVTCSGRVPPAAPTTWGPEIWLVPSSSIPVALSSVIISLPSSVNYSIQWSQLPAGTSAGQCPVWDGARWSPGLCGSGGSMTYPGAGLPISTGSGWGASLTPGAAGHFVRSTGAAYADSAIQADDLPPLALSNLTDGANAIVATGSYSNPGWISSLAWGKITGVPSFALASDTLSPANNLSELAATAATARANLGLTALATAVPNANALAWITSPTVANLGTSLGPYAAGYVLASPASVSGAIDARRLVGSDLPMPTATTVGGVKSAAPVTHQFLTAIGTDGSVSAAQPSASDVSGLATVATSGSASDLGSGILPAARLPNPGSGSKGGVYSITCGAGQHVSAISATDGSVTCSADSGGASSQWYWFDGVQQAGDRAWRIQFTALTNLSYTTVDATHLRSMLQVASGATGSALYTITPVVGAITSVTFNAEVNSTDGTNAGSMALAYACVAAGSSVDNPSQTALSAVSLATIGTTKSVYQSTQAVSCTGSASSPADLYIWWTPTAPSGGTLNLIRLGVNY